MIQRIDLPAKMSPKHAYAHEDLAQISKIQINLGCNCRNKQESQPQHVGIPIEYTMQHWRY
jgi:hypothetical protein